MIQKIKVLGISIAMIVIACSSAFASDYENISTEDMAGMRGSMQYESREDRAVFQREWQKRTRLMSTEQRKQYMGQNQGFGPQDGTGSKYKGSRGSGHGGGRGSGRGSRR